MPLASIAVGLEVTGAFLLDLQRVPRPGLLVSTRRATMSFLPFAIAAWLFVVGLWGVVTSQQPGAHGPLPDRRAVVHLSGAARHRLPPRRQGADRRRHPAALEACGSRHAGARAHRHRDRGDRAGAAAGAGRPGAQAVRQRRSGTSCARCATEVRRDRARLTADGCALPRRCAAGRRRLGRAALERRRSRRSTVASPCWPCACSWPPRGAPAVRLLARWLGPAPRGGARDRVRRSTRSGRESLPSRR